MPSIRRFSDDENLHSGPGPAPGDSPSRVGDQSLPAVRRKKRAVRQQCEGHLPGQPRLHVVRHEGRVQPLQRLPLRRFRLVILRRAPQHRRHPPPHGRNPHLAGVHRSPHAFRPAGREPHAVRWATCGSEPTTGCSAGTSASAASSATSWRRAMAARAAGSEPSSRTAAAKSGSERPPGCTATTARRTASAGTRSPSRKAPCWATTRSRPSSRPRRANC